MVPMTGMETATTDTVADSDQKEVQKHSVVWLERELAEARNDLQNAGHRLDAMSILLTQKNDDLVQARNERDDARYERDCANVMSRETQRLAGNDRAKHLETERQLRSELSIMKDANVQLARANQRNFDKASRRGDVAAILACMVAKSNSPAEAILKMSDVAVEMNVGSEILEDVRSALKRGYSAQVDEVVDTVKVGSAEEIMAMAMSQSDAEKVNKESLRSIFELNMIDDR